MGINGAAYVVYTTDTADVRAVRLQGSTWEQVAGPLDIQPGQPAGDETGRPRVGVSAEGNAVAVWGEGHPDGRRRIYARRLTGLTLSAYPQEVSVPDLGGQAGGAADTPDMDIEDDGSFAWVTFRQVVGGVPRVLARRLVGSTFDPAVAIDGGPGSTPGRVAINGKGVGVAAAGGPDNSVVGSLLFLDVFGPGARLDDAAGAVPPQPVVGSSDNEDSAVAWLRASDAERIVLGRRHEQETTTFEPQAPLSQPAFGPAAPDGRLEMASDRVGDHAVAFVQGNPGDRRVVIASYDRAPGKPFGLTTTNPRKERRPRLKWRPGVDLWGVQTFKVMLDGAEIPVATTERSSVLPPRRLADGAHLWQVIATDRRGQTTEMTPRVLLIDATPPRLSVRVTGRRVAGGLLRIRIRATDRTGVKARWVTFGDGTRGPAATSSTVLHRYRAGLFKLTVHARDGAGNVGRKVIRLRIR
jgi:hypothetical protein